MSDATHVAEKSKNGMNSRLVIISANANSLKNKIMSLKFNMDLIKPHIVVIQETKIKRKSQLHFEGYRPFATLRGDNGGGLLVACLNSLNAVLVIQVVLGNRNIRIIAGYGPQECAPVVVREKYRNTVEEQTERAHLAGCSVIIAEDANAKLGSDVIPGAPNQMSENGKLLHAMIQRQQLSIINNSDKCIGGPVTRCRETKNGLESACIDYVLTSPDISEHLEKALVDSKQLYSLTKYTSTKGNPSIKRSDHFTFVVSFNLQWEKTKPVRQEFFKLRDNEGLLKFNRKTEICPKLINCIQESDNLESACNSWYKEIDRLLHQCFKKVRVSSNPPKNTVDFEISQYLTEIKMLKEQISSCHTIYKAVLSTELNRKEKELAELQGIRCKKIINESTKKLTEGGCFNMNEAWKLKKKIYPKCSDPPFAVLDHQNNLVTDMEGILDVMKEEFKYRLRNRPIQPEYQELRELKEYLCHLRLQITRTKQYNKWGMEDLEKAISKLQRNKCRDPHGHINELYQNMGRDGLASLLNLLNIIKDEIMIPSKLNISNVSTIYKGKGSKQDVVNLRGIFKLPIIRNILDRMVCNNENEQIGSNMGQFQVGNQKERNIRDHTLVVHSALKEAEQRKIDVDVLFIDIKQCFDSIWLDEATNDLYQSGLQSRNLNLLYEGNKKTRMCVETNYGKSGRVELNKVVMQGSVTGGMFCSNQISKLCNKLYREGNVYMYAERIPIPPLAMVDDIAILAICNSLTALESSVKTDTFIQRKKLEGQTGEGKCQWVHKGSKDCRSKYIVNNQEITQAEAYKYLGDQVADKWEPLYTKRMEKAQGYSIMCLGMSSELSLGYQMYSVAKLLRMSIFLNGTLTNMETWPNCNTHRIESFERIEQSFIRKLLQAHSKTPIECLYLELGILPFRFHLMMRRIMYLNTILNRDDDEITKKVVQCEKEMDIDGSFYTQTKTDMEYLSISEEIVKTTNKHKLKDDLIRKAKAKAFEYLIEKAKKHSKVNDQVYTSCDGCTHYNDSRFTPDLINILFRFRSRTFLVKNNFRNNYRNSNILCPLCHQDDDTQEHLFECRNITNQYGKQCTSQYTDIYSNDIDTLLSVAIELKNLTNIREKLLNPDDVE